MAIIIVGVYVAAPAGVTVASITQLTGWAITSHGSYHDRRALRRFKFLVSNRGSAWPSPSQTLIH